MNATFSTIEEYIHLFNGNQKEILQKVNDYIKNLVPHAKATISYKLPTYKLNGNLIHFGIFKNHLGLYPGEDAIQHFGQKLKNYKTTKGAIQIPLSEEIPFNLIKELVLFNYNKFKDQKKPDWKRYDDQYDQLKVKIQQIVDQTELVKEFKWGGDIYTYNGKNVLAFSGFKNHFSLWFHQGVFLKDKEKVLISANEEKTKGLRQWRFKTIEDLDETKVKSYILEAIENAKFGKEFKIEKSKPKEPSGILKLALTEDLEFNQAFFSLTPGKRKDYIEYIEEAKQEKTKRSRLEKIKPMVLKGFGLNDKYKK